MRALIIEKNITYRELLEHTFAEQGFDTDAGDSIESAHVYADSWVYDIICVNQTLTDGPGEEFVAHCNQHERLKNTPVLFLTENTELQAEELPVRVAGVIHELSEHQIEDQIVHFIDLHLDPVFFEGRILFVEDDDEVAADILAQLEETGYQVSHFKTAEEACAEYDAVTIYGSHAEAYDLAITEIKWSRFYSNHCHYRRRRCAKTDLALPLGSQRFPAETHPAQRIDGSYRQPDYQQTPAR
jgi:DNA-binding response OmpR family regulator